MNDDGDNSDSFPNAHQESVLPATGPGAEQIRRAVEAAPPRPKRLMRVKGSKSGSTTEPKKRADGGSGKGRSVKIARADRWVAELTEELELWHTPTREAYATLPVGSHHENWPINSERFRHRLRCRAIEHNERLMGKTEIENVCAVLAAMAEVRGPQYEIWTRVGKHAGSLFIDLGGEDWCCVEIAPADMESDGPHWVLRDNAPVKFVRRSSMRPMAKPQPGGSIDLLRPFLNVETEGDFQLIVGWLIACLRARGPYPILVINGTQGSGKSNMLKLLSRLVDPTQAPERNLPKEERDLFVAAMSSHLQTFDNLSGISNSMADALCRIATSGGYSTRSLHTNDEQHIMQACKPVLLNGIPDLTRRGDVADRSIVVTAARLTPERRRPEEEFWQDFSDNEAMILGAMFDAIAYGLKTYRDIPAPAVRMADAARFMSAAGEALGWERDSVANLLSANRLQAIESVVDDNPFALTLLALLREQPHWRGSTAELLSVLTDKADERKRRSRAWPITPSGARAAIDRTKDAIEASGFTFERGREGSKNEKRFIQFMPLTDQEKR